MNTRFRSLLQEKGSNQPTSDEEGWGGMGHSSVLAVDVETVAVELGNSVGRFIVIAAFYAAEKTIIVLESVADALGSVIGRRQVACAALQIVETLHIVRDAALKALWEAKIEAV